jgi:hypothetical protein
MEPIRIGVIKEGKVPPDFRTPLTPHQCKVLKTMYPKAEVVVQSSPLIRNTLTMALKWLMTYPIAILFLA